MSILLRITLLPFESNPHQEEENLFVVQYTVSSEPKDLIEFRGTPEMWHGLSLANAGRRSTRFWGRARLRLEGEAGAVKLRTRNSTGETSWFRDLDSVPGQR